jgi:hypothetical protein
MSQARQHRYPLAAPIKDSHGSCGIPAGSYLVAAETVWPCALAHGLTDAVIEPALL